MVGLTAGDRGLGAEHPAGGQADLGPAGRLAGTMVDSLRAADATAVR